MNRIRELRRKMGLSSDDLAKAIGTTGASIRRLELGETSLTVEWMTKVSEALECAPADLLANTALVGIEDEVRPASDGPSGVAAAIRRKGLIVYEVLRSAITCKNINPGDIITVDETVEAVAAVDDGNVVLARVRGVLTLRQYLRPGLLVTNRVGNNIALRLDDPSVPSELVGVVILP